MAEEEEEGEEDEGMFLTRSAAWATRPTKSLARAGKDGEGEEGKSMARSW